MLLPSPAVSVYLHALVYGLYEVTPGVICMGCYNSKVSAGLACGRYNVISGLLQLGTVGIVGLYRIVRIISP